MFRLKTFPIALGLMALLGLAGASAQDRTPTPQEIKTCGALSRQTLEQQVRQHFFQHMVAHGRERGWRGPDGHTLQAATTRLQFTEFQFTHTTKTQSWGVFFKILAHGLTSGMIAIVPCDEGNIEYSIDDDR